MALPDAVMVYPAHGAGSLCGRAMRAERSSTIGTERLTNYALQIRSREEFVAQLTANLPTRPEYFLEDAEINRSGAATLTELPPLPKLSPSELRVLLDRDSVSNVLDVRAGDLFAAGHVPGSINIALAGQFASWAGGILGIHSKPVLIGDNDTQIKEARLRLARVGIEDVRGYLDGGVAAWGKAGLPVTKTAQISAEGLNQKLREGSWRAAGCAGRAARRRNGRRGISQTRRAARWILFRRACPQSIGSDRLRFIARADIAALSRVVCSSARGIATWSMWSEGSTRGMLQDFRKLRNSSPGHSAAVGFPSSVFSKPLYFVERLIPTWRRGPLLEALRGGPAPAAEPPSGGGYSRGRAR